MNIRRDIAAMVAAGLSASVTFAQAGDNTRRGLNRPPAGSAPAAASTAASRSPYTTAECAAAARAGGGTGESTRAQLRECASGPGTPGLVRPVRVAPPASQPSQGTPTPRAAAPQNGESRSTPTWTPRQRVGTPQNPATADQTKRALNRDPAPKQRPLNVVQLPSGDDTARSRFGSSPSREDARRGSAPVPTSNISAPPTSITLTPALQAAGAASIARSSDNTRRNLVKPIPSWNGDGGGGETEWPWAERKWPSGQRVEPQLGAWPRVEREPLEQQLEHGVE